MNKKALVLFSGGLDSALAIKVLLEQGIEVIAITFITPFNNLSPDKIAQGLDVELKIVHSGADYVEMVKKPKYGYGKNMNPCIDCKIFMLKKTKGYMEEVGASFVATGEVLGERPMSQRKDTLWIIERDSDLKGLLLRPLSAKLLPTTIMEEKGVVERERLLDIQGRSRKPQMALAKKFGIKTYQTPAGGCLLTDEGFSRRLKDILDDNISINDIELLKVGRHFRLDPKTKIIVGRDDEENKRLLGLTQKGDILFKVVNFPGPITILRGEANQKSLELTAKITSRYSKAKEEAITQVSYREFKEDKWKILTVSPIEDSELEYNTNPTK